MIGRKKKSELKASKQNSSEPIPSVERKAGHRANTEKSITQKKAIEGMIPYLLVLRKKGWSWNQITRLLNEECKFKLQASTVRSYFNEMVPKDSDI